MFYCKLLFLLISSGYVFCHESADDEYAIKYTIENFTSELKKKHNFVMFYAPWCGYCKRLFPTWELLAEMLNEDNKYNVRIAKVDCTVEKELCSIQDITGYPTLKFYKQGSEEGLKFKGTRDIPSLNTFINDQIGSLPSAEQENVSHDEPAVSVQGLINLNEDNFEKHVSSGKHFVKFYAPWCAHCQILAPTWEKLAETFASEKGVSICKIDCTQNRQTCNQFDVKGYPTLLWIEDGKKIEKYQGQRALEDLKAYVSKMMGNVEVKTAGEEEAGEIPSAVLTLTGDDFEQGIKNGVSFVKFFAPWCGHCKRLAPTWEDLGKKFISNPNINIIKVDCTVESSKQLCNDQEVDGFPTLLLYKNGEKLSEYSGSRSVDDLEDFVMKNVRHDEL